MEEKYENGLSTQIGLLLYTLKKEDRDLQILKRLAGSTLLIERPDETIDLIVKGLTDSNRNINEAYNEFNKLFIEPEKEKPKKEIKQKKEEPKEEEIETVDFENDELDTEEEELEEDTEQEENIEIKDDNSKKSLKERIKEKINRI
jgi:hypothetical protein